MKQYLDIARTILETGIRKPNRTGIDTLSCFGLSFRHELSEGFPLLTTKKMDGKLWHSIVEELLWFISGQNHIREFKHKSGIWDAWADENGDLETAYGHYWTNFPYCFGGKMLSKEQMMDYFRNNTIEQYEKDFGTFNQLEWCVNQLKTNPNNRRLIVNAWEPFNAHRSKLPPCHFSFVFNVQGDKLCLAMNIRSQDLGLGAGFNIASYALLTHIVAREVGLKPGTFLMNITDSHIYIADPDDEQLVLGCPRKDYDHTRVLMEQIKREPLPLPTLEITGGTWNTHKFEDFKLHNYKSHGLLRMKVAV